MAFNKINTVPVGIWCQNDVIATLMRRDDVASTLIGRHFYVICQLEYYMSMVIFCSYASWPKQREMLREFEVTGIIMTLNIYGHIKGFR